MNGLETKLLVYKFSLCTTVLIVPPQYLLHLFFPLLWHAGFCRAIFLSRNLITMYSTRDCNLEYHRAITIPDQENFMDLWKHSFKLLSCATPRMSLSSKWPSWALAMFPMCLQYYTQQLGSWCQQKGQQCCPDMPTDLGVSHSSWNMPLRIVGSCSKTYDHGRALWFGPMNSSYFCPYFTLLQGT